MDAARFAAVAPKFDTLIEVAASNDKKAVRAAVVAIMAEAFTHHSGMTHEQVDEDKEEHDSKPPNRKFISAQGTLSEANEAGAPMHRVAARALVFDLMYLLARTGR